MTDGGSMDTLPQRHGACRPAIVGARSARIDAGFVCGEFHGQYEARISEVGAAALPSAPASARFAEALLHESSLARTRPTDRILTCRCGMTLVGRGRSSD